MDIINEGIVKSIAKIAMEDDPPLLMINQNRYKAGLFPGSDLYKEWRAINAETIGNVIKIPMISKVEGFVLSAISAEQLDEILAYWHPSHSSFLKNEGISSG